MSEKELEERVMLDENQFLEIKKYFQENFTNVRLIKQENLYFDDANNRVHSLNNMLRIRIIYNDCPLQTSEKGLKLRTIKSQKLREFTYKVKGEDGDIEYTQLLTHYWYEKVLRESKLPNCATKDELVKDGVNINTLKMLISLSTERLEIDNKDHTLILDKNLYNGITDYNLEIESKISKNHAKNLIYQYCEMFNIQYDPNYKTKVRRAFESIKR